MTHLFELDDKHYKEIKAGAIHFLIVKQNKKQFKRGDIVIIQSPSSSEDELTSFITFVSEEKTEGLKTNYTIINIENK